MKPWNTEHAASKIIRPYDSCSMNCFPKLRVLLDWVTPRLQAGRGQTLVDVPRLRGHATILMGWTAPAPGIGVPKVVVAERHGSGEPSA